MIKDWKIKRNVDEEGLEAEDKEAWEKHETKTKQKVKPEHLKAKVSRKESSMPDVI